MHIDQFHWCLILDKVGIDFFECKQDRFQIFLLFNGLVNLPNGDASPPTGLQDESTINHFKMRDCTTTINHCCNISTIGSLNVLN